MTQESTILYKNCSVSKNGIVFTVYCGKNPTLEAKKEVKRQLIEFITNHDVQSQQLINIAVSKSADRSLSLESQSTVEDT
jgi:hypothetical protein